MNQTADQYHRSEVRDRIRIDWHVPIPMDDGVVLRADVYRPDDDGRYPAVMSYGPYAKGLSFQEAYAPQWEKMVGDHPDVAAGSSNKYQNWEVVDPEKWVPEGYAVVRVDSRGTGWSPGYIDVWATREARDFYECIEWAGQEPWSNGKVGLDGISYYAINQWHVAGLQPPHLTAMVAWEGAADMYRDVTYHGGILSEFCGNWYPRQVEIVQYGLGERARKSPITGESVAGPVTLSDDELARNRADFGADIKRHPLDDQWHRDRSADWSKVKTPFLSAANWGGQGLHPRGNFDAFAKAASDQKWLEVHGDSHWSHFYTDYGRGLQKRFFDHFLKGEDNGWQQQARVILNVRHPGERFVQRSESEWPLAGTRWTSYFLDPEGERLSTEVPARESSVTYNALGEGLTFSTPPLTQQTEITGPITAKLFIAASTKDADIFLAVRVFDPRDDEVVFMGALDPNTPIALGWLRASHRRLDPHRSLPHQPFHSHDRLEPLEPGEVYELDVEVWPTCIVVPSGYRISITLRGKDYEYGGELSEFAKSFHYASRGTGPFLHNDPDDRPPDLFGGEVTLYAGGSRASHVVLPVIPPDRHAA
ncbi:MAG: CocE/NonD family hydrolase [Candidatus Dormibacteraeota bacterium]|uniref:CocE/NonD family hydrolase n=1 Tax=Candidatus Dormiibacter inghamiae TaxID=3127013 RepID=A0A934NF35_9BACT|nr:CocE/NonD family hydrolase [Candidatus Dormibacteraeota bacterium]MBJ7606167.1 CocE/NonD family hydrolase [Candidatus Dormibacteraeota bacterium]